MAAKVESEYSSHPAWVRLEDQVTWYSEKSKWHQTVYKSLKAVQIVTAAGIPLVAFLDGAISKWATAIGGSLIAVIEGLLQLGQHAFLWVTYRATAESLKHEKALFLASGGPYKNLPLEEQLVLLSERVEERVSSEHANWINESTKKARAEAERGR